jgi:hypothetical protein
MPNTILKRWNGTAFEELYPKTTVGQISASGTPSNTTFLRGDGQWVATTATVSKDDLLFLYMYGKAESAITKGQAVQFAGVQGDHILMKPAVPSEINANPDYFMGIAESTLATNDFGYVLTQGELVGVNTNAYTEGAILWFASAGSTAGALTATEPVNSNSKIQVASVNKVNASSGILFVRVNFVGTEIEDIVASGTAGSTTFLRGDGAWEVPTQLTDTRITNSAVGVVPLIVNGIASTTANLLELKINNSEIVKIDSGGKVFTNFGIGNRTSGNNASLETLSTGSVISRNVADANPALIVNQVHASSTGNIANFQFGGANKLEVTKDGFLNQNGTRLFHQRNGTTNTFFGNASGNLTTTTEYTTAFGNASLLALTSGSFNTAVGGSSLFSLTTGGFNTSIGLDSGRSLTTGSNNTFVGSSAGNTSQVDNVSNSTAIGNEAYTTASNQMVFGNASVTQFKFDRNASATLLAPRITSLSTASLTEPQFFAENTNANSEVSIGTKNNSAIITALGSYGSTKATYGISGSNDSFLYTNATELNIVSDNASGTIKFGTGASGSTERMRIASDGKVGIGTNNPTNNLQVQGTGATFAITNGSNSGLRILSWENNVNIDPFYTAGANSFRFGRDFTLARTTFESGRVGIGMETPINKLEVRITGADSDDGIMITRSDATTTTNEILGGIGFDSTDGNVPSSILEASAYIAAYAAEDHSVDDKGGYLTFGTASVDKDDDTVSTERMRITAAGNVGIGTASPGQTLDVNGAITTQTYFNVDNTTSSRTKIKLFADESDYAIGMQNGVTFGGLNDWSMTFQFNNDNSRGFWWGDTVHTAAQGAMALTTNGLLTVASGIRVGYGESDTTTPTANLVDVSGNIAVSGTVDGVDIAAFKTSYDGHGHGNITNAGAIGSTATLPIITTTSGVLTTGSFGTTSGTFAQGNDARLSDARTPTSHATSTTTYGAGTNTNYGHVKGLKLTPGSTDGESGVVIVNGTAYATKTLRVDNIAQQTFGTVLDLDGIDGSLVRFVDITLIRTEGTITYYVGSIMVDVSTLPDYDFSGTPATPTVTTGLRWRLNSRNSSNTQVTLPIFMWKDIQGSPDVNTLRIYVDQSSTATYQFECVGYY